MAGSGWRAWARERVPSAWLQSFLQDQVVQNYTSRAARIATGPAAPSDGMVSWLQDEKRLEVFRGGGWNSPNPLVAAILSSASNVTVTPSTWTPLTMNGAEELDTHGGHDPVANPSRWTCPANCGGMYLVEAGTRMDTGTGVRSCGVMKNGTIVNRTQQSIPTSVSQAIVVTSTPAFIPLVPGDYVEAAAFQTHTSNLIASAAWSHLTLVRLGAID